MTEPRIVVIGGSSGSWLPLARILADLPNDFSAPSFVVLHGARGSVYSAELLKPRSKLDVVPAVDGSEAKAGSVYLAPFDQHLLFEGGRMRLVRGPRENRMRPSIDVLFRSAAVEFRSHVIGILLSGTQSDGVAGLLAVKRCGGTCIVQHPGDASFPELPQNALDLNAADHVVNASEIADVILRIAAKEPGPAPPVPDDLKLEVRHAALQMQSPTEVPKLGENVELTCPECGGPMWLVAPKNGEKGDPGARFRCEIGHSFTTADFLDGQSQAIEQALWIAFRTLKERSELVRKLAESAEGRGFNASGARYREAVADLDEHSEVIRKVLAAGTRFEAEPEK